MSEIAQRLRSFRVWSSRRGHYDSVPVCQEGAAEIERLREALQTAKNSLGRVSILFSEGIDPRLDEAISGIRKAITAANAALDDTGLNSLTMRRADTAPSEPLRCLRCGTVDAFGPAHLPHVRQDEG